MKNSLSLTGKLLFSILIFSSSALASDCFDASKPHDVRRAHRAQRHGVSINWCRGGSLEADLSDFGDAIECFDATKTRDVRRATRHIRHGESIVWCQSLAQRRSNVVARPRVPALPLTLEETQAQIETVTEKVEALKMQLILSESDRWTGLNAELARSEEELSRLEAQLRRFE